MSLSLEVQPPAEDRASPSPGACPEVQQLNDHQLPDGGSTVQSEHPAVYSKNAMKSNGNVSLVQIGRLEGCKNKSRKRSDSWPAV